MPDKKDKVFELLRLLAIKDRQLFEERKALKEATHRIHELGKTLEHYKSTNFFLRESIKTLETKFNGITDGILADIVYLPPPDQL